MRFIAAGRSDVGLQREHNEDSFALLDHHGLFIVADGMGGHRAGDVASRIATEAVSAFFDITEREDATWPFHYDPALSSEENRLLTGIKVANKSIYEASARSAEHRGMGTTVVGMLVSPSRARVFIGHVGDSRCYRIRARSITLLTQDHSLVNEYIRAMPELTEAQRDELPRNVITRALGMTEGVQVDLAVDQSEVGDRYLLCSDGLSGMLTDEELRDLVVSAPDPDEACRELIRAANERGGEDNITAVVLAVEAPATEESEVRVTVVGDAPEATPSRLPMTTYPAPEPSEPPEGIAREDTERIATNSDLPPREPATPVPGSLQEPMDAPPPSDDTKRDG
ncbi:MAG: Stp1/IreP family PP2C-type Ser/Thr phosphatase [Deltaproteobacteria bacterium]|nr:Stp1/IreP family PP2C-type Ser/Thr phosphatase [Deltaproteobacteria bacterium]